MEHPAFPPVAVGKTALPLRPDPQDRGSLPHWCPGAPLGTTPFHLLDGPPYANGAPHLGHVLNKHLKDAVARAAHAQGYQVVWRPGWDCHGLPLELAVEKQGHHRTDRFAFVAAARAFATSQVALQASVFQQQGWSTDWTRPWTTQDPVMEAGTMRVLADLLDRGLLRTRFAAVPWCPLCQSTLSGAEQESRTQVSQAWLVPFELEDGTSVLSWTTTPWTLPLHHALVVHPTAGYACLRLGTALAWVSEETLAHWQPHLAAQDTGQRCLGRDLVGKAYRTPWTRGHVVDDVRVLPQAGTGALHAVPGLAELDSALAQSHGWPTRQWMGVDGRLTGSPCAEQEQALAGSPASVDPVRLAYTPSPWFQVMDYSSEHPHCWRHHVPLLTRPSRQLFLVLDDQVRARAQALVDALEFTPAAAGNRLRAAMASRPDWCLSRQRTWGVPVGVFLDRATGQPHARASTWLRRAADAVAQEGVEAWWNHPASRWLQGEVDPASVERMEDVLDVWFDSGCVPQLVGAGNTVVEGIDQHRGWFQSCLWLAAAMDRPLPFKRVVTHGFVLASDGQKLSKSKGGDAGQSRNLATWDTLPSDVVRLWALAGNEGQDKAWSQDALSSAQGAYMRLRGVLRFLLANALPQSHQVPASDLPAWDRYWWRETARVSEQALSLCLQGRSGEALSQVLPFADTFSSVVLGSWKDRLYCAPANTVERQRLDAVVRACLFHWARVLSVLLPRALSEARSLWPSDVLASPMPALSETERNEVEQVLALRAALAPELERQAQQKGGPSRRRLLAPGLPGWEGQLLADALGVGQAQLDPYAASWQVELSADPTCPRCRRPQPAWTGSCCAVCQARTAVVAPQQSVLG